MEPEFWHRRWREGNTPFHQGRVNDALRRHWPPPGTRAGAPVLVPLCGKALDLAWLAARGHGVVGVELSPVAVADFMREQGIRARRSRWGPFERWVGGGVTLLAGDFFAVRPADVGRIEAVYDRAALIALPATLRGRYVEHLEGLLPDESSILLLTLEYPEGDLEGPPFSVGEHEVRRHFAARRSVTRLASVDILDEEPGLRRRGASALVEHAFALGPRGGAATSAPCPSVRDGPSDGR